MFDLSEFPQCHVFLILEQIAINTLLSRLKQSVASARVYLLHPIILLYAEDTLGVCSVSQEKVNP